MRTLTTSTGVICAETTKHTWTVEAKYNIYIVTAATLDALQTRLTRIGKQARFENVGDIWDHIHTDRSVNR